mgnify:FL=1
MIDIKLIRDDVDDVIKKLSTRGKDFNYLRDIQEMDIKRRQLLVEVESLKQVRNENSKLVGQLKSKKQDATEVLENLSEIGGQITDKDNQVAEIEKEIENLLLTTPNILHNTVPIGKDETENVVIKHIGKPMEFKFPIKAHYEIGEALGILDFERAAKVVGSRFVIYKGLGARLERALIAFMMDTHAKKGYTEVIPPYIVNRATMTSTGQLPKFEEEAFKLTANNGDWFLNPTAEVPTIGMYRNEIIDFDSLPQKYVSYTMAFRSEAGSAGRDTRGLIRTHQFNKVELIKFAASDNSYDELESMLKDSETILQLLKLPYRVISLCSGDMGFSMAKTYDIEVWIPSQGVYREIGSISNAEDYQARRGNIRTKRNKESKPEYVHTLNGSGLAVGRTVVAILENYQNEDGTVKVPEVLIPYMGTDIIK